MNEFGDGQPPVRDREVAHATSRSWYEAVGAIAAALVILAIGAGGGTLAARAFEIWVGADQPGARPAGAAEALNAAQLSVFLVGFQIASIVLTLAVAPYFARPAEKLLPLGWPRRALWVIAASTLVLFLIMLVFGTIVYVFDRDAFVSDVKPFADMAQSRVWWALLIGAAIGAPIAEELLFRGLLFGVLRDSRLGLTGTMIVTAALWATLHMQYSLYGLAAIFLIGLYLGWLRERTGSLIPPIFCHALYNGAIVVALANFTGPHFSG
jgi:membrane protease YdiL (CAAX protease family)